MLRRLDGAVPGGTKVVILQPGGNDRRKNAAGDRDANIAAIKQKLSARGVAVIVMENNALRGYPKQSDGQHLTAQGYHDLAVSIASEVASALGN